MSAGNIKRVDMDVLASEIVVAHEQSDFFN